MTHASRFVAATAFAVLALAASRAEAQQVVTVTVPAGAAFTVNDVGSTTTGTPNPFHVSYSNATLFLPGQSLRISVKADSSAFSGPGTTHPAASKVKWTASTSNGTASGGTMSSSAYSEVYRKTNPSSGSVDVVWTLDPIAASGLRSGTHTLTVRWKFEAF